MDVQEFRFEISAVELSSQEAAGRTWRLLSYIIIRFWFEATRNGKTAKSSSPHKKP